VHLSVAVIFSCNWQMITHALSRRVVQLKTSKSSRRIRHGAGSQYHHIQDLLIHLLMQLQFTWLPHCFSRHAFRAGKAFKPHCQDLPASTIHHAPASTHIMLNST
jgi:hypothetical protein